MASAATTANHLSERHARAALRLPEGRRTAALEKLRLVDRAKCYLIEKKGMTETEAHRLIEKGAMDTRRSRGEVAQEILEAEEDE